MSTTEKYGTSSMIKFVLKASLLMFLFLLSINVKANETPEKFKNPLFNQPLELSGHMYLIYQLTPNKITELRSNNKIDDCQFIAEDDKSVLLKCASSDGGKFSYYDLYFVRTRIQYIMKDEKYGFCRVWNCSYPSINYKPAVFSASDEYCQDEELIDDNGTRTIMESIDCREEFIKRGWDKFIPDFDKK